MAVGVVGSMHGLREGTLNSITMRKGCRGVRRAMVGMQRTGMVVVDTNREDTNREGIHLPKDTRSRHHSNIIKGRGVMASLSMEDTSRDMKKSIIVTTTTTTITMVKM